MLKLIKQYKEGLRVYICSICKHRVNIPKNQVKIRCLYCGDVAINPCKYWYEDNIEICKATNKKVICSGEKSQCQYKELFKEFSK